jgi:hypothetical protein
MIKKGVNQWFVRLQFVLIFVTIEYLYSLYLIKKQFDLPRANEL